MTDHLPAWGNGRHEFREPFDGKESAVEKLEERPEFPGGYAGREELMVWETYQQLGKISFHLKYENARKEVTSRTVTPLALTLNNGNWGFFAVCELRNTVRWFRFDRVEGIDPLPVVRHLTQWEASARLLVLASHERQSILDALGLLDPVMYEKLKRHDYKRPAKQAVGSAPVNTINTRMTWDEWAHIAGVSPYQYTAPEYKAWKEDVDPREFREKYMSPRERMKDEQKKRGSIARHRKGRWGKES